MSPEHRDGRPGRGQRLDPQKVLAEAIAGGEADHAASGWEPPAVERLDEIFGELDVVELIGRGGMGAVYRVVQRKLDRTVALKVLPPELAKDATFEERFLREARALAGLKHERILTLHDFGERDGIYYLVTEFVEGMNLRQLMDMGELSPSEALRITPQVCEALQYAHDHGVVHRDIKPENLLIDTSGDVRIADFGLARILNDNHSAPALTRSTQVLGTPQYMAPEQWRDGQNVDHRADIYAVGVVLYEMLTGQLPLGHFDPPSHSLGVPPGLDAIVKRTLAQHPEQRYQRAGDVREDLERQAAAGPSPPRATPRPNPAARQDAGYGPSAAFPGTLGLAWGLLVIWVIAAGSVVARFVDGAISGEGHANSAMLSTGHVFMAGLVVLAFYLCGIQTLHEIRNRQRSTAWLKLAVLTTWLFPVIALSAVATAIVSSLIKDSGLGFITGLLCLVGGFVAMGLQHFSLSREFSR